MMFLDMNRQTGENSLDLFQYNNRVIPDAQNIRNNNNLTKIGTFIIRNILWLGYATELFCLHIFYV